MKIEENIYGHKKKLRFILKTIKDYSKTISKPLSELKVLDFGCGNSTAVSFKVAALGVQLTGLDFHSKSIKFANANNQFPNSKYILGDEDTVSKLGEYFDIIIYSDVIEHLSDPLSTLKKIRRVHKDGGLIIISIPNGFGPFEIENYVSKLPFIGYLWKKLFAKLTIVRRMIISEWKPIPDSIPYNQDCVHVHFFNLKKFSNLMKRSGYKILHLRNGAFLGSPSSKDFFAFRKFIDWNVEFADKLPHKLVSTWYFICKKMS